MGWCCAKQAGSGRVGGEALVSTTRGGTYTSTSSSQEGKVWRWERGRCRGRRRGESRLHPAPCWWKSLVKFHSPQNWAASGWGRKNKPEMTPTLQELRDSKLIWKDVFFFTPFFLKSWNLHRSRYAKSVSVHPVRSGCDQLDSIREHKNNILSDQFGLLETWTIKDTEPCCVFLKF